MIELVAIVALALGLALGIQAWLIKPYQIPSGSMEPTLDVGQRILVNRFIYDFTDPKVGDIVVFHPPQGADEGNPGSCGQVARQPGQVCPKSTPEASTRNFVKRLVAGPGDRIKIIHGQAIVNGKVDSAANASAENKLVYESCGKPLPRSQWRHVKSDSSCNFPNVITLEPNQYFMMGDNRGASDDSRYWGPIPRNWIIGEAFASYWPPDRWGILN